MTETGAFPQLSRLMNAYLNQDYDLSGEDDKAVLDDYAQTTWAADVRIAVAELERLLGGPTQGLLDRFEQATGRWNHQIGEDDAGARAWLGQARDRLSDALARGVCEEAPS